MKKHKVYVAGSSMEPDRVERVVATLEGLGVEVIGKWTPQTRRHGSQGLELERVARQEASAGIRATLLQVDGFLFLTPRSPATTKGGFWECGFVEGLAALRRTLGDDSPKPWLVCAPAEGVLPEFILDVPRVWAHAMSDADAINVLVLLLEDR